MRTRHLVLLAAVPALTLLVASAQPAGAGTFAGRDGAIAFASATDDGVDLWTVCPDGSRLVRVVHSPHGSVSAYSDWSPDGRTLAFDSDRSGDVEIYLEAADGSVRRLTHDPAGDSHPTWSPDGRRIAFESERSGTKQIWVVPRHGGQATQVTHGRSTAEEPAYSPTGEWIAYLSGPVRRTALFVVRPDGTDRRQLTRRVLNAGHPSWSPDGSSIVFNSHIEQPNGRIWTVDLAGHTHQVTFGPKGKEDFEPTYSPDGRSISFSRYRDDPGRTDIWVVGVDGRGAHDLTPDSAGFDVGATWAVATPLRC